MTQPMSRDTMRGLKAKYEEAARIQQVKQIVQQVYQAAVQTARSKDDTSYNDPRGAQAATDDYKRCHPLI